MTEINESKHGIETEEQRSAFDNVVETVAKFSWPVKPTVAYRMHDEKIIVDCTAYNPNQGWMVCFSLEETQKNNFVKEQLQVLNKQVIDSHSLRKPVF